MNDSKTEQKKQYLSRNLVWNKHYQDLHPESEADSFLKLLQLDERIRYCIFAIERGLDQSLNKFHFQGYLDFNRPVDVNAFKKKYQLSYAEKRQALTQKAALDYVKKTSTKISDKFYEIGEFKKELAAYDVEDRDVPSDINLQRIWLNHELKAGRFTKFEDIEQKVELLYLKNRSWCKNLWDQYHPILVFDRKPCATIWVYGPSGIGKSTLSNNYLKEKGYSDQDVCLKSYEGIEKLWFNLVDEGKKVLWIEEVRRDFPHHNHLLKLIDKKDWLPVKGSQIKPTFDLIVINSLHSPEEVYDQIAFEHRIEILRRLYLGNNSKVYELIPSQNDHNQINDRTLDLPLPLASHFQKSILTKHLSRLSLFALRDFYYLYAVHEKYSEFKTRFIETILSPIREEEFEFYKLYKFSETFFLSKSDCLQRKAALQSNDLNNAGVKFFYSVLKEYFSKRNELDPS